MELAIATDYRGELSKIEDMEACLREIAEAGFSHIHWCFEWTGDYIYSKTEMYQIQEWMEKYGLKAKSLHASHGSRFIRNDTKQKEHYRKDYTSDTEFNRIAGRELFQGTAENIPLSEEAIVKLSVKFFNDPAPCEIHRSAVRIRAFYEVWEACPEEGKIRFNELPVELQEFFGEFPSESYVVRWVD